MTTEQAQQRLEEIRRLLTQREKAVKIVDDIDMQISSLAGVMVKPYAPNSQKISKNDFIAIATGGAK